MHLTSETIRQWLEEVKDPEIPVLSLVDLGVISDIKINENNVEIELTPTFVGCPALDVMKEDIINVLSEHGVPHVKVNISYRVPWTSDRISEKGKDALKKFGLAPPPARLIMDLDVLEDAVCPRCNGTNAELRNTFGPTLCRSIHYCNICKEAFEQFKPV